VAVCYRHFGRATVLQAWVSGILFGAGGFQLFDGIIQHKWFHLHQIRYDVTIWPYDLVWNVLAAIILILGGVLLRRTSSTCPAASHS